MPIKRLTQGIALVFLIGAAGAAVVAQPSSAAPQSGNQGGKPSSAGRSRTAPNDPQRPPTRRQWWTDEASKKELGLTAEQAKTIDQVYTSTKDELAGYLEAMQREGKELDRLITESKVEQWVVLRQIEKVETQRSNANKLRLMTLYRMHRLLTPEQRVKLEAIRARDHKDPRKRP